MSIHNHEALRRPQDEHSAGKWPSRHLVLQLQLLQYWGVPKWQTKALEMKKQYHSEMQRTLTFLVLSREDWAVPDLQMNQSYDRTIGMKQRRNCRTLPTLVCDWQGRTIGKASYALKTDDSWISLENKLSISCQVGSMWVGSWELLPYRRQTSRLLIDVQVRKHELHIYYDFSWRGRWGQYSPSVCAHFWELHNTPAILLRYEEAKSTNCRCLLLNPYCLTTYNPAMCVK